MISSSFMNLDWTSGETNQTTQANSSLQIGFEIGKQGDSMWFLNIYIYK